MEDQEELEGVPDPGDVIVERYRVDSILGVGGMGCVVAATHMTLDTKVAVKFLLAKAAKNPKNITRFQREAQAAAKIKSDHVAKVSDVGTLPTGVPYMVMEYLDGEDLSERLKRGPIPPQQCVDFVLQASEALSEAHRAGIIHRDLKPANLFLTHTSDGNPRIKVLDFGISKIVDGAGNDLTKTSALMGSPLYMSPEQMMSAKAADARADIWALGCILFEGITCQPPFIGETLPEICSRILTNPPAKLTELAPYAGPHLEGVIERCLSKKPEERFQTLAEMAEAMAPFATPRGARSVNTIRRVQGLPELPQFAGATTAASQASSQIAALQTAHGAAASGPYPAYQSYPDGSIPGTVGQGPHGMSQAGVSQAAYSQAGASHSGPHTAQSPQHHLGATTPLPHGTATGSTSHPDAPAMAMSQALAQGASTGAPVAQTMSGEMPVKRSKLPIVMAVAALALVGVGAAVLFGLNKGGDDAAPAAAEEAALEQPAETAPREPEEPETTAETSAETAAAATSSSASATPVAAQPAAQRPPPFRPPAGQPKPKPAVTPAPKPAPKPAAKPKPGTTVKPGDDQFNTF